MSENGGREQPRSGERMQPTAQAVGGRGERASPGGEKDNVAYVRQHPSPSDLQHSRTPPLIETGFRSELFAYLGGIVREMQGTGSGRTCPRRKNKFLSLGSRKMEPKF